MNIEDALLIIDEALPHKGLSNVQELLFRQAWEGKTYPEIAENSGYDSSYIRDVGYKLWQALSKSLGERVTKNNLQVVLRRYALRLAKRDRHNHHSQANQVVAVNHSAGSVVMPLPTLGMIGGAIGGMINSPVASGLGNPSANPNLMVSHSSYGDNMRYLAQAAKSRQIQPVTSPTATTPIAASELTTSNRQSEELGDRPNLSHPANVVDFKRSATHANHATNVANITNLHGLRSVVTEPETMPRHRRNRDWGSAIDTSVFYGRTEELATLSNWILDDRCRLVGVLGIGGVGKTSLAIKLAEQIQHEFNLVIWRSLRHTPNLDDLLIDLLQFLQGRDVIAVAPTDKLIAQLIGLMRSQRCLILLDDVEAIMSSGATTGTYQPAYANYGELLRQIGEVRHQSCVIVTSREKPLELNSADLETPKIKSIQLAGLSTAAVAVLPKQLMQATAQTEAQKAAQQDTQQKLIDYYGGNPLALKIVSRSIQDLFDGNISEFLNQGTLVFSQVRHLLQQQCDRLSPLEARVMYWLAILRLPATVNMLQNQLVPITTNAELLEALSSLRWRSLIEKAASGFTQQPLVMAYITEQLIEQTCAAIISGDLDFLNYYLLSPSQSIGTNLTDIANRDRWLAHDQHDQVITMPTVSRLLAHYGNQEQLGDRLTDLQEYLRQSSQPVYHAATNLTYLQQYTQNSDHTNAAGLPRQITEASDRPGGIAIITKPVPYSGNATVT
jgi:hypothetical protein